MKMILLIYVTAPYDVGPNIAVNNLLSIAINRFYKKKYSTWLNLC